MTMEAAESADVSMSSNKVMNKTCNAGTASVTLRVTSGRRAEIPRESNGTERNV